MEIFKQQSMVVFDCFSMVCCCFLMDWCCLDISVNRMKALAKPRKANGALVLALSETVIPHTEEATTPPLTTTTMPTDSPWKTTSVEM